MNHSKRMTFVLAVLASVGAADSIVKAAEPRDNPDAGRFVNALWLAHRYGFPEVADPGRDLATKATLAKALGKDGALTLTGAKTLMNPETFTKLAGSDGRLDPPEVLHALAADAPASRHRLRPRVADHAAYLTTSFDLIDERHREAGRELADWIVASYRHGQPLRIIVVCTGNSRRSILGATMGNVAADYYGLPEIRFYSGGTTPSAFNTRTITALKEIGVEVEATGREALRGESSTANPVYLVRWGQRDHSGEGGEGAAEEFSKHYSDSANPQKGFAALMVCSEADEGCPFVKGATLRVSMPYLDPKLYDGGAYESAKYAERRDDMGRWMLSVMMNVRNRLAASGKLFEPSSS